MLELILYHILPYKYGPFRCLTRPHYFCSIGLAQNEFVGGRLARTPGPSRLENDRGLVCRTPVSAVQAYHLAHSVDPAVADAGCESTGTECLELLF
jgi:hypothetical protein